MGLASGRPATSPAQGVIQHGPYGPAEGKKTWKRCGLLDPLGSSYGFLKLAAKQVTVPAVTLVHAQKIECSLGSLVAAVQKQSLMAAVSPCKAYSMSRSSFWSHCICLWVVEMSMLDPSNPVKKKKHTAAQLLTHLQSVKADKFSSPVVSIWKKIHGIGQVTYEIPEILVLWGKKHPEIPVICWVTGFWHVLTKPSPYQLGWIILGVETNKNHTPNTPSGYD